MHGRAPRRRHGADQHLTADAGVEDLLRELAPRVLVVLVRRYEDFAVCEDAVQEALVAAAQHWTKEGVPTLLTALSTSWSVRVSGCFFHVGMRWIYRPRQMSAAAAR